MDLLPGICALVQQWLGDVALPGFRGMPATVASLNAWFTNRQVVEQLRVREDLQGLCKGYCMGHLVRRCTLKKFTQGLVPCQGLCRVRYTCEGVPPVELCIPVDC